MLIRYKNILFHVSEGLAAAQFCDEGVNIYIGTEKNPSIVINTEYDGCEVIAKIVDEYKNGTQVYDLADLEMVEE